MKKTLLALILALSLTVPQCVAYAAGNNSGAGFGAGQSSSSGGGGPPSGSAGGDLGGTYPNPNVTGGAHLTGTIGATNALGVIAGAGTASCVMTGVINCSMTVGGGAITLALPTGMSAGITYHLIITSTAAVTITAASGWQTPREDTGAFVATVAFTSGPSGTVLDIPFRMDTAGTNANLATSYPDVSAKRGIFGSTVGGTITGTGAGITALAGTNITSGTVPASALSTVQGNGAKVQLSTGTTTTGDCVKYDANGNAIDGALCGPLWASNGLSLSTAAGTNFFSAMGTSTIQATEGIAFMIAGRAGTVSNLYCWTTSAQGAAKSDAFTIRQNSASSAVTCTATNSTNCTDLTHSFAVAATDFIDIQDVTTGTAITARIGGCTFSLN